jgi:hypothetical protein
MPSHLLSRRDVLRVGTVAIGSILARPLTAGTTRAQRARAVILLFMDGGPSHIDLFDMKPGAPEEVRGPFKPIRTSVPGVSVCEHLPRLAARMDRVLQVRSVRHTDSIHDPAVYLTLTGKRHPTPLGGLKVSPDDAPHVGALYAALSASGGLGRGQRSEVRSQKDQVRVSSLTSDLRPLTSESGGLRPPLAKTPAPKWVELPETMKMEARTLPGQNGGLLGASCDPFRAAVSLDGHPEPPPFDLPEGVTADRLLVRGDLRGALDRKLKHAEANFDHARSQALELLASGAVRSAFDLAKEPDKLRDAYGRHRHGQSVLLARRLVEAGTRFVTVYWGKEEQDWADGVKNRVANNPWDTHRNHFPLVKDSLCPRADQALAALIDDLSARGLLDEVLVVWMGEFGRTPVIDRKYASRDHWPGANTILFAGGGVAAGHVIGRTDAKGAEVIDSPVSPADVTATLLAALGANPRAEVHDRHGRPFNACDGVPIDRIYTG